MFILDISNGYNKLSKQVFSMTIFFRDFQGENKKTPTESWWEINYWLRMWHKSDFLTSSIVMQN